MAVLSWAISMGSMTTARRLVMAGLSVALLVAPIRGAAQQAGKVARIGVVIPTAPPPAPQPWLDAFRQALRELGYVEGSTITLEVRWGSVERGGLDATLSSMIRLPVDVIVVPTTSAAVAAKRATQTIPVVAAGAGSLVESGVVASLARPGGNVTGLTTQNVDLTAKRVEVLKEAIPSLTRVVGIEGPITDNPIGSSTPGGRGVWARQTEAGARAVGVQLQLIQIKTAAELDGAFRTAAQGRAGAVITLPHPFFVLHAAKLAAVAIKHRLPVASSYREEVEAGTLLYYGVSRTYMWRRAAGYVDKILKGAKPGDLPVEQPTKFELVINLRTAKALDLKIPPAVLDRADEQLQ
jgi:putative ABC transport system substrate-binding protein